MEAVELQPDPRDPDFSRFANCPTCLRLISEFDAWREAAYWRGQHGRAVAREAELREENQKLLAELRLARRKLFSPSSESGLGSESRPAADPAVPPRKRGGQPGAKSPPKRDYSALPAVEEIRDLPDGEKSCAECGCGFVAFAATDDSEILEVAVRPHRRSIRRRKYRPACACSPTPTPIFTAPPAPRLIPKGKLGVSIWTEILLDKYLFGRPTERLLKAWALRGLDLAMGTVTDGLKRLEPLFAPLQEGLADRSRDGAFWHADETRWEVFVTVEDKVGHRWYLWVFHAPDAVVFLLSPTRARSVPETHFGPEAEGILVVDRYAAYKSLPQVKGGKIALAFCWAHVRRDFLRAAQSRAEHEAWGLAWVDRIGRLYALNDARLDSKEPERTPLETALRGHLAAMERDRDAELATPDLPSARRKALASLREHWVGLTVFVERPDVPMDNNAAERDLRGPVVGRKNYYGSGSEWSGRLAAALFGLFQTLCLARINPLKWLTAYLEACAQAGGKAPANATDFLPWNLGDEQKRTLRNEPAPPARNSS